MRTGTDVTRPGVFRNVLLAILCVACSSDGDAPLGPDPGGDPDALLECDRAGYPCSPTAFPVAVLRRSEALADSAASMFRAGDGGAAVTAWIDSRSDVVEVQGDAYAVRFRVVGGRPMWVVNELPEALGAGLAASAATGPAPRASNVTAEDSHQASAVTTDHSAQTSTVAAEVVGDDPAAKRALILAPFAWEFAAFDETAELAELLSDTRGYEGRVQFVEATSKEGPSIPMASFTTWDAYDVVHISSHGRTICDATGCRAQLTAAFVPGQFADVANAWNSPGVVFVTGSVTGRKFIALEADFFLHHYPGGVGDVIVFLSACESLGAGSSDLADAIRGSNGVFLGWSAPVTSVPARNAALAFYGELSDGGVATTTAYNAIGGLKTISWVDDEGNTVNAVLQLASRSAGGDLRLREIAWIESPSGGAVLEDGASVRIRGTLGDGRPDSIPYRVRVDGVDGPPANFRVRVDIDGQSAVPVFLSSAQTAGEQTWVVAGVLAVGRDLAVGEMAEIRAIVELPDQGTSTTSVEVALVNDPGVWVGEAVYVREAGDDSRMVVEAKNLRFQYRAEFDRYQLTQGTLIWTDEGRTFNAQGQICSYSLAPTQIVLQPGSAFIQINTGTNPATYGVYGSYEGTQFTIPTSCANLNLPMKLHAVWMRTSNGVNTVSNDGSEINGFYIQDFGFLWEGWAWTFTKEADW